MLDWIKEIASVVALIQGLRLTEAKIQKLKAETKKLEADE